MAERKKLDKKLVEDLAVGCVTQVKEQGACIARVALIAAQWPEEVTGFTINRFCGSGLEAVNNIAAKIGAGFIDGGIGGGVESMSRVPMGSDEAMLDGLNEKLRKRLYLVPQGISADLIATREGFTPRRRRQVRAREPAEGGARDRGEAVRERDVRGQERRRLGRARPRRAPARGHHARGARRA